MQLVRHRLFVRGRQTPRTSVRRWLCGGERAGLGDFRCDAQHAAEVPLRQARRRSASGVPDSSVDSPVVIKDGAGKPVLDEEGEQHRYGDLVCDKEEKAGGRRQFLPAFSSSDL